MNNSISYDIKNAIKIKELFEKARTKIFEHNVKDINSFDQVLIEIEHNDCLQMKQPPEEDGKGKG